ncbi:MAG: hypothetical protein DIU77_018120 [Thermocrispum agreste]|uniref:Terminase n=1 Tax=Thermocrispum agreste TaxID=37925 RepID=A0ABD6FMB4_9PSEU
MPKLTLGYAVAQWMERWLVQPNGPDAGKPFRVVDSQLRFLAWWYAVDEDGHWLFHHGVRRLAKGSGKSPFAAALALAELCGPVRLKDFDAKLPGGCVGKRVDMPWVQIAATAESQTANTMRMVRAFAPKRSKIVREYELDPGKTIYYAVPEGKLEVITSSSTAAEGAEASFVVADETEHWKPSNGGPELAATLEDNLAKSGSRMLETSNAWVPGAETVAEATWEAWLAQEEGLTKGDSKILYDARVAPPGVTPYSPEPEMRAALEHVYGDCYWVDLRPIMNRIWDLRSSPEDSQRKYFNRPTKAAGAWCSPEAWALCADVERIVADEDPIVLFFDGSKSDDSTALIGCDVETGHLLTLGVWERPLDPVLAKGWEVDRVDVDRTVRRTFEHRNVVAFFADVREFEQYVDTWGQDFGDRLVIDATGGKTRHPVAWDMRTHVREFTEAAERMLVDIEARAVTHDGDWRLARHIANCQKNENKWGVSVSKESRESPRKIDAAVCAIGARMVRRLVLASPAWEKLKLGPKKRPGRVVAWG